MSSSTKKFEVDFCVIMGGPEGDITQNFHEYELELWLRGLHDNEHRWLVTHGRRCLKEEGYRFIQPFDEDEHLIGVKFSLPVPIYLSEGFSKGGASFVSWSMINFLNLSYCRYLEKRLLDRPHE